MDLRALFGRSAPGRARPGASRLPRGLAAFRHRNYRLFWFGQLVSVTGTWMQTLAESWLVLSLTTSAVALGLVAVCQFAPVLLLGLAGGVVADRFPKRMLLVGTQTAAGILAAVVAVLVWTGQIQLWHVYAVALALGVVNAVDMPTRQAFVVEMVGPDDLMNAIALNSSLFNAARIIGPALAGLLLAVVGIAACFAINAASYLAVIAGLLLMRIGARPRPAAGNNLARLREGLAYVRQTPDVLLPIVLVGATAAFGMNFNVWIPLLAKQDLGVGAGGFGLLMSALGVGSLVGALGLAFAGRHPRFRLVLALVLLLGGLEIVLGGTVLGLPVLVTLPILAGLGFAMTTSSAMANTRVQAAAPDHLRGRVMSVYMTVFAGTGPFGALLAGALAAGIGTTGSLVLCGAVTALAALGVAAWHRSLAGATVSPADVPLPVRRSTAGSAPATRHP